VLSSNARARILRGWSTERNIPANNFRILPGDITAENLGLSVHEFQRRSPRRPRFFTLAALYDLALAREAGLKVQSSAARATSTGFARSVRGLRRYHYVSTCYVAGRRKA